LIEKFAVAAEFPVIVNAGQGLVDPEQPADPETPVQFTKLYPVFGTAVQGPIVVPVVYEPFAQLVPVSEPLVVVAVQVKLAAAVRGCG
jgi:hypothetical protein